MTAVPLFDIIVLCMLILALLCMWYGLSKIVERKDSELSWIKNNIDQLYLLYDGIDEQYKKELIQQENSQAKQYEKIIKNITARANAAERSLKKHNVKFVEKDTLCEHQIKDIFLVREKFPEKTASMTDVQIANRYSQYCEMFHGARWTDIDIDDFGKFV